MEGAIEAIFVDLRILEPQQIGERATSVPILAKNSLYF
jgi:hypothetical protein